MDNKRIRTLLVEMADRDTIYVAGKPRPMTIGGKKVERTITNIVLVEDHFEIHISEGVESRHWKDVPKNNKVTIEYYID